MVCEDDIQEAIAAFLQGNFTSERACVKHYGIPRSTFKDRLNGAEPHKTAHSNSQKLMPAEEDEIVQWILSEELVGTAVSYIQVQDIAEGILKRRQPDGFLGHNWLDGFKTRQLEIVAII
jgi:hypothetical protein